MLDVRWVRLRWVRLGIAAAVSLTGLGMGCSAGGDEDDGAAGAGGAGAASPTGTSGGEGGANPSGVGVVTVGVGSGGACPTSCSADLKSILDCNNAVLQTCATDTACLNGSCSDDPCAAADAAQSSTGCDYWAVKPDLIPEGNGACFAAYIANTWDAPVRLSVSYQGAELTDTSFIRIPQGQGQSITYGPYDPAVGLPVGEVAILFLAHQSPQPAAVPSCPVPAAINAPYGVLGTGIGDAFNIVTDRPVVGYTILPYGGGPSAATSASLLLPTSAWDTNYIAVNAYEKSQVVIPAQPSLNVLAREDATQVTILPGVAIVGGAGVAGSPANVAATYTLNAGQYLQLSQNQELTGSPIQSDKPVGVWGAASCLNVPANATACDSAHQQIPPVRALGSRYAGVRYRNRSAAPSEEEPPWRLVGAVDGTQLTWSPAPPPGAPATLNLGQVAEFDAAGPFVVASQDGDHPFYLGQYMTGGQGFSSEGDPEWVNVVPIDQYLDGYVFFTDPTYPETSLVVVRRRAPATGNFADVTLDCAGVLTGWQPVGDVEFTRVDMVTGNFDSVNGCSNGRHEITSDAPFGVTVWGWGSFASLFPSTFVSYAYPAGASVQSINDVVVPPIPR
ncbi:MAG: IgGFc-binding protein [Myxococcota bacterium]